MRTYRKKVYLDLECRAKNQAEAKQLLNEVAHGIHSLGHPLTTGGKEKRTVSISHKSRPIVHVPKRMMKKAR